MSRGRIGATVLALAALIASHGAWAQKSMSAGSLSETSYGSHSRQTLAFARPNLNRTTPVLLFVHGGGWAIGDKARNAEQRAAWLAPRGWAYATTNYRLVPDGSVEEQAADVASAIAWIRREGSRQGLDADRIVLMGHSAGAHLAALVASDPRYLKAVGVPMEAVRGVVLLDGAGYDVARQMKTPRNQARGMYQQAFGSDPERQKRLSPISHAAAPNAARWLILPVARRADAVAQGEAFAAKLRTGGAQVTVLPQPGKTHRSLNQELGMAGDPPTALVEAFLQEVK